MIGGNGAAVKEMNKIKIRLQKEADFCVWSVPVRGVSNGLVLSIEADT